MSPISIGILILLSIFALQADADARDWLIETTTENFYPIRITAQIGDQIQWKNLDMVSHEIVFTGNPTFTGEKSIHFFLPKGKTVSITLEKPGRYPYKCRWHGMFGEIEVRAFSQ
ncbi:MAG: cupredoxin domain-containing protein [Nitrospirae bacterium]|nr:cupredoxin domain-containing protein [Nitrospirota bacterium]